MATRHALLLGLSTTVLGAMFGSGCAAESNPATTDSGGTSTVTSTGGTGGHGGSTGVGGAGGAGGAGGEQGGGPPASDDTCGNGLDDDGDGSVDEACPCTPETVQPCFPGAPEKAGKGACTFGEQTCQETSSGEFAGGEWGVCLGAGAPTAEACNGADDDCNGQTDEGCACMPGAVDVGCYSGPPATMNIGACHAGSRTCLPDGLAWGACMGEQTPVVEVCGNSVDDDCDGVVDEGCACAPGATMPCYSGPAGTAGVGACHGGVQTCAQDGSAWGACMGEVTPQVEACGNGVDDDCDGQVDEGCAVCAPQKITFAIPAGTMGGRSCITTGGGTCEETVTCNGGNCNGGGCGQPHCGTLICNDGTYVKAEYCSVIAKCTAGGIVATGFTW